MSESDLKSASHTIPKTMCAAAIDRFCGPEVLSLHSLPVPGLDPDEVLIAVDTAGVGGWDADMRDGWSPSGHTRFPLVLRTDGAGIVAEVGSRVRRFKIGDQVYAYSWANPKGGFYAEYVAVTADKVAHVPSRLDLGHAGAIATTGLTALRGVDDALRAGRIAQVAATGAKQEYERAVRLHATGALAAEEMEEIKARLEILEHILGANDTEAGNNSPKQCGSCEEFSRPLRNCTGSASFIAT